MTAFDKVVEQTNKNLKNVENIFASHQIGGEIQKEHPRVSEFFNRYMELAFTDFKCHDDVENPSQEQIEESVMSCTKSSLYGMIQDAGIDNEILIQKVMNFNGFLINCCLDDSSFVIGYKNEEPTVYAYCADDCEGASQDVEKLHSVLDWHIQNNRRYFDNVMRFKKMLRKKV